MKKNKIFMRTDMHERSTKSQYTGFQTCIEMAEHEDKLRARRIYLKEKKRELDVILKPLEYLKYMESIRAQIRK